MRKASRWFIKKQPNLVAFSIGLVGCLGLLSIGEASFALEDEGSHAREAASLVLGNLGDQRAGGPLRQSLRNRDPGLRGAAAGALGASGDDRAYDSLLSAIGERGPSGGLARALALERLDEPLRILVLQVLAGSQQAMEQLVTRNDPRALPPLVKALSNWDPAVRQAAAGTLKTLGNKEVVDLLIKAREDLNPTLRREAAGILGAIGDQRAMDPLIQALGDNDPDVRVAAAQALGEIGDNRARDSLISALSDRYSGVRLAATLALERLGEPLGALIHQTLAGSQQAMEQLVTRNDPRSFPPLVKALGDGDPAIRRAAVETLKALGIGSKEVVDLLIKALEDLNPTLRRGAAWILNYLGGQRMADPMIQALGDWDPEVRRVAARTLKEIGAHKARDPLIHALGDSEPGVREAAAWGLMKIGDRRALDSLLKALGDRNSGVRRAAAFALRKVGDQRAVEPLLKVLGDGEPGLREAAAWALGDIGDRRAEGPLVEALGSRNSKVRKAAAWALELLGEPLGRLIRETLAGSQEAMQDLVSRKDPRALDPLIQALGDRDSNVRRAAARSLGRINDARAVDGLVRMASGWNLLDRVVATAALVKIDQEGFSDYLFVALTGLTRPASVVYLLGVWLFVFVTHKTARWVITVKAKPKPVDIFKAGPTVARSIDHPQK